MEELIFGGFFISGFLSWIVIFYVESLLAKKGYETSLLFLGVLFKGMKKLSREEKKYRNLYYFMYFTTLLPFFIMAAFMIYMLY